MVSTYFPAQTVVNPVTGRWAFGCSICSPSMSQRFNFDQLRIHCSDDYGDFITTAVLVWDVPQKDRLQRWYGDMTGCAFSPEGEGNVQTARKVLMKTAQYFSELAEGEQHHYQLRISGAARKVDGRWKITSMHMSEPNL